MLTPFVKIKPVLTNYYRLTKPGIVYSNVLTAAAGYVFGARWHIHWLSLLALLTGAALIIAAACVYNNCLDRGIDQRMQRTQQRALVTGAISLPRALLYATILAVGGFLALSHTNYLTLLIGAGAIFSYVVLYGAAKRHSVHGTLVGTIPGAAALVAGDVTATGRLDLAALLLFLAMVAWQMAHFYAIATYRLRDYRTANLPVWPVKKGIESTKIQIVGYIMAFLGVIIAFRLIGSTGYIFMVIMAGVGGRWLMIALGGIKRRDTTKWARQTFLFSLVVLLSLSIMLPIGTLLP